MIAKIIVDNRSRHTDRIFDYDIPKEFEDKISIGSRVLVPFSGANKEIEGFCVGIAPISDAPKLKKIIKIANDIKAYDEKMLEVIEFMHNTYLAPYIDIIHSIVPSGTSLKSEEWIVIDNIEPQRSANRERIIQIILDNGGAIASGMLYAMFETDIKTAVRDMVKKGIIKKEYRASYDVGEKKIRAVRLKISVEDAKKIAQELQKKAPVQARMIEILISNDVVATADLSRFAQGSASALMALCKKGITEIFELEVVRDGFLKSNIEKTKAKTPTKEQAEAICEINKAIDNGENIPFLLHGVTGSGKTEVFMQSIEYALKKGKTAIVLVPEISLTSQMVGRFVSRFGSEVAVFHSRLSQGERYDQWRRIKNGDAKIVIGARSAIFAPLNNIGIIIMDEEHSETYKSEMSPRYHAREIASFRAKQWGAPVIFASATPSIESFYNAKRGMYKLLTMPNRYNNNELPDITITDMRNELRNGNRSMFSKKLISEIDINIKNGEQTILLMNRRGFSTFVSCRSCGYTAHCPNCNISLTYHKYENNLKCHYCGHTIPNYVTCPACDSKYIRYFGGGTQRVEDELKSLFPHASTIRMDVDTTSKKQGHEKILQKFEKEKTDILIGTQMVSKGLDFENVTLVGVVSADTMLHLNDYRSAERTFAMLEQVCGRAGRGKKKGRAIIQTYNPESNAVSLVKEHNYNAFFDGEIKERKMMWYPPFSKISAVCFSNEDLEKTAYCATLFKNSLGDITMIEQNIQILGPIPASVSKIKNKYRYQLLVKYSDDNGINEMLINARETCINDEKCKDVGIVIDKNPNLLF